MGSRRDRGEPTDPTWADLKQLGWALLLVYAVIALLVVLARQFFGLGAAVRIGGGLAAFVTAAFGLITGASLLVSYGADVVRRLQDRRARRRR